MNKKGFTLVELMVVIVIIGILAAVAAPRLSDNINSARCNEVPKNMKKLFDKAVEFEASGGLWPTTAELINDGGATNTGLVKVTSSFWTYAVTSGTDAAVLTITATNSKAKIGAVAQSAGVITVDNEGNKSVSAGGALLKTKYMKAYLADASQL